MATKFNFEPSAALLLVMRAGIHRVMIAADYAILPEAVEAAREEWERLGRQARKALRKDGFEPDCEIDLEMVELADKAQDAVEALGTYIAINSPKTARFLAKHGKPGLQEWQERSPKLIRPKRRL